MRSNKKLPKYIIILVFNDEKRVRKYVRTLQINFVLLLD